MKKLKQEKGSITLFVLVSMLFFVLFLTGMYMLSTAGEQAGISETARIKEIYEKDINQIDDVYATLTKDPIYYATDKEGNKIPVPEGFSPITTQDQGTKYTGFVIKNDTDGNEFVWVPVDDTTSYTYDRYTFLSVQPADGIDNITNSIKIKHNTYYFTEAMPNIGDRTELQSVTEYGGFYIGRYEVGVVGYDSTVSTNNSNNETSWTGYSNGTAVVQKGCQVWNYITRDKASEIAESMYSENDGVTSKLCSSYAWDTALKFIETQNSIYPTNSTGGNYTGTLQSTGYDTVHPCNIYDMGGNVFEWTTEFCSALGYPCTARGGTSINVAEGSPASIRGNGCTTTVALDYLGFRSTLFL